MLITTLVVSPATRFTNMLLKAYDISLSQRENALFVSGVGQCYWLAKNSGKAVVTMNVKGNNEKLLQRIRKAYAKIPSLRMLGILHPGSFARYVVQQGEQHSTMYFLTSAETTNQFLIRHVPVPSFLDGIFAPPVKKTPKKKKRKTGELVVSAEKAALLKPRQVDLKLEENEEQACVVCYEYKRTHMCFPCMHFSLCSKCADKITECPSCRTKVDRYLTPIM